MLLKSVLELICDETGSAGSFSSAWIFSLGATDCKGYQFDRQRTYFSIPPEAFSRCDG